MKKLEELVLELVNSQGKKTIINYEDSLLEELLYDENSDLYFLLNEIKDEYESNIQFKNQADSYIKRNSIQSCEFFISAILSGFESLEKIQNVFWELIPKEYPQIPLNESIFKSLLFATREKRRRILESIFKFDQNFLNNSYTSYLKTMTSIRSIENKEIIVPDKLSERSRELGILYTQIQNYYTLISHVCYQFPIDKSPLLKHYEEKHHNLKDEKEFEHYGLITINEDREMLDVGPRIYDKKYDLTIFLHSHSLEIYFWVRNLSHINEFQLSFRPVHTYFERGKFTRIPLYEAVEYGKIFDPNILKTGLPRTTKLYDYKGDNLWVVTNQTEITFEEILNSPTVFEESYMTNLFHFQFVTENSEQYLVHFDHEYIFYTEDQYLTRLQDPRQKGKAQKRVKTFKIDNAKIKFTIDEILFPLLSMGFQNKALVYEYFSIDQS